MSGEGQVRSQWNQALLDDCVAPAFCFWLVQCSTLVSQLYQHACVQAQLRRSQRRALLSAAPASSLSSSSTASVTALVAATASSASSSAAATDAAFIHSLHSLLTTFFAYFPTGAPTSAPFARLVTRVYAIMCDQPVIYAPIGGGALLLTHEDAHDQTNGSNGEKHHDNDGDEVSDDADSGLWLIPAHTLRLPAVADRVPGLDSGTWSDGIENNENMCQLLQQPNSLSRQQISAIILCVICCSHLHISFCRLFVDCHLTI
jgi:hypothetical protein